MKRKGLSNYALIGLATILLASCQEEEFYEKEMFETYEDQYQKTFDNNPDDPEVMSPNLDASLDDVTATDPDNPDNAEPVDDGTGTDDGSTTDSGTVADDGSTTDDGTVADDGSTTDDGTVADDGSTTDDGTVADDGSTTDDGTVADDGSTTDDGTVADGSTTDAGTVADNGSTTDDENFQNVWEQFSQASSLSKIDILWVIDNSGSMSEEQDALAYNFDVFIKDFAEKQIDFQMAITTTDTRGKNFAEPYQDSLSSLTSEKLAQDKERFLSDFSRLVRVGIDGWGREKGIKVSERFTNVIFNNGHAPHYFRDDAYYVVVYVSDEEDQSEKAPNQHLAQMQKWKSHKGLVKAYSIVNMSDPYAASGWHTPGYERYAKMSELTGGKVADINKDFYETLKNLGTEIVGLTDKYPLGSKPVDSNAIKVFVNSVEWTSGWTYSESNNTIHFTNVPSVGSTIQVDYQVQTQVN